MYKKHKEKLDCFDEALCLVLEELVAEYLDGVPTKAIEEYYGEETVSDLILSSGLE